MLFKYFIQEREVVIRGVHLLKIPENYLWRSSFVMKLRDANLQFYEKKALSCILLSFSQNASRLLLPMRLWKCTSTVSFRKYKQRVVLLVFDLFNYESLKLTFFMLNMASDAVLSTVLSNKLELFVCCNTKITRTTMYFFIKA